MPDLQGLYRGTLSRVGHRRKRGRRRRRKRHSYGRSDSTSRLLSLEISIAASIISFPREPNASSIETQGSMTIFPPSSLINTVLVILSFLLSSAGMTTCPFEETRPRLFIPPGEGKTHVNVLPFLHVLDSG